MPDSRATATGEADMAGGHRASAQLYDPNTSTFTDTPAMLIPRSYHTAALLNDGRVLMAGGWGQNWIQVSWGEIYDPVSGTFQELPRSPW
jgi:hypothetical protein